jgi:hypothetical protein
MVSGLFEWTLWPQFVLAETTDRTISRAPYVHAVRRELANCLEILVVVVIIMIVNLVTYGFRVKHLSQKNNRFSCFLIFFC